MDAVRIAVLMTVYNEKIEWVAQSINSVLKQTYEELKLYILLDNPENREAITYISDLQKREDRVVFFINSQNIGLVASLNKLIDYIEEDYVARMDADDISVPGRLEKELAFLQSENLDFVMSGIDYIYDNGKNGPGEAVPGLLPEELAEVQKYSNVSNHPTWLLKTDTYRELGGYRDIRYCEDLDFVLRAIQAGYRLGRLADVLLHYRLRDNSVSRSYALEQFEKANYLRCMYRKGFQLKEISDEFVNRRFDSFSEDKKQKFIRAKKDMDLFCDALYSRKWMKCFFLAVSGWTSGNAYRKIFINGINSKIKLQKVYKTRRNV